MATAEHPAALVIGASRGLGLGLVEAFLGKGWRVAATKRGEGATLLDEAAGKAAGRLDIHSFDVTSQEQCAALRARLGQRRFDLLFVNAGVIDTPPLPIGEVATEEFIRIMLANALGAMRAVETLKDVVAPGGTIGVMSSGLGSVANNTGGGFDAYRASKAGLNTLMRCFAARSGEGRTLLIMDPGWVRTDMGGPEAPLSIEESVAGMAAVICGAAGAGGLRFLNYRGETVPW